MKQNEEHSFNAKTGECDCGGHACKECHLNHCTNNKTMHECKHENAEVTYNKPSLDNPKGENVYCPDCQMQIITPKNAWEKVKR